MWDNIHHNYRAALAFAVACPVLFLIPVVVELAQHVVELRLGMYESLAAFRAQAANPDRTVMGLLKVGAMLLPSWWFIRYIGFDGSPAAARRLDLRALGLWGVTLVWSLGFALLDMFGPSPGGWLGLGALGTSLLSGLIHLAGVILGFYLLPWTVAWTLGNAAIGPLVSIRLMRGYIWCAVGYAFAGALPLIVLHYALGYAAVGLPVAWAAAILVVDALVVGILTLTINGSAWLGAWHAARDQGVSLRPPAPA